MKNKNDHSNDTVFGNLQSKVVAAKKELSPEVIGLIKNAYGKYDGNSNHNNPKSDYLQKLVDSNDEQLKDECERYIWLSAYASNNPRSDYHWQCDACYDECNRRGKIEIYNKAHKYVSSTI